MVNKGSFSGGTSIVYNRSHWDLLEKKREIAKILLSKLSRIVPVSYVYGSIARGDVNPNSDIDILLNTVIPSYNIDITLDELISEYPKLRFQKKSIVMATPNSLIKGVYELNFGKDEVTVHLPLKELTPRDIDFYNFGGKIDYDMLKNGIRVVGVNKELTVIIPIREGHIEQSLQSISKKELIEMGISQQIIEERERVLNRRKKVGKTGVFVDEQVPKDKTLEQILQALIDNNSLVKKHFRRK